MSRQPLVLIAEDDVPTQGLLSAILRGGNARVLSAYDGEAALAIIRSQELDAVVLDMMMPRVNGMEVLRAIAAERSALLDRIVVLTAASPTLLQQSEEIARVRELLPKPFEIPHFIDALRRCCPELTFPLAEGAVRKRP